MRKLKPPQLTLELVLGLSLFPLVVVIALLWGLRAVWGSIAIIEVIAILLLMLLYLRTKNNAFIWMSLALFFIALFAVQISVYGLTKNNPQFVPLSILVIVAFIIIIYLQSARKVKWRTREVLELAAMPVSETRNGFTERPLAIGKIDGTRNEMEAFALFMSKNMVAIPFFENGKIIFSLANTFLKRSYIDETWVSFDDNGNVIVSIARKDYLKYQDALTFDRLCIALGNLFIEFFELYKHGDGVRIIDRLNALRLNPFTE